MNNRIMAQAVQAEVKPKFRGREVLKAKVQTHFPSNLAREYERITNAYMTLLNQTLAEHLPDIRLAIDEEAEGMRTDAAEDVQAIIARTFTEIQKAFESKAESFGLRRRLENLGKLTRKLSIAEWKRVVHKTVGIDILEDYYKGEFHRHTLELWTKNNADLITSVPQSTISNLRNVVKEGYLAGRSNAAIGREIQQAYGVDRRKAQFWARDQIAKLNSDLTREQQKDAGVDEYVWSDSGDARVRDRHEELNGKRFSWNAPPVVDRRTGRRCHPGEDYNCRCVALPVFNLSGLDLPWAKGPEA